MAQDKKSASSGAKQQGSGSDKSGQQQQKGGSGSVEPHEPPNTTQRSISSIARRFSMSATRCAVVLSRVSPSGVMAAPLIVVVR